MDKPIIECGTCGGTDAPAGDGDVKHAPTCGFGGDLVHLLDDLVSSCRTEDDDAIWSARDRVISFFSDGANRLRDEEERHAALQARCHEGFPSATDGIFDAFRACVQSRGRMEGLLREMKAAMLGYPMSARALTPTALLRAINAELREPEEAPK